MKKIISTIFTLIVILFVFLYVAQYLSSPVEKKSDGFIKYELIDLKNKNVTHSEEIKIKKYFSETQNIFLRYFMGYIEKNYFKTFDDFVIGHSRYCHDNKQSIAGFGMWLDRLNNYTFSWEWYEKVDQYLFKKLQGKGNISVEYEDREGCWIISKTTFIGDHTFRAKRGIKIFNQEEDWHFVILDGSYIKW